MAHDATLKALKDIEQIIHDYLPPAREITAQEALEEIVAVMDRGSVMRLTQKVQKRPAVFRPSHSLTAYTSISSRPASAS